MKKGTSNCSSCGKTINWNKSKTAFQTGIDKNKKRGIAHWHSEKCYNLNESKVK